MKLTIDIVVTLSLLVWPMLAMFSAMAFDAPGSENNRKAIFSVLGLLFYPVAVFLAYKFLGGNYFGLSADLALRIALAITIGFALISGLPRMALNTFLGIPNSGYFIGKSTVYSNGRPLRKALPASFEVLDGRYTRDARHVFYWDKILIGADAGSFAPVLMDNDDADKNRTIFWKDNNRVYANGVALRDSRAATFRALSSSYGRDDHSVYYDQYKLEADDPHQFVVLNSVLAKDGSNLYLRTLPVTHNADLSTFRLLDNGEDLDNYGKDNSRVFLISYWGTNVIVEIEGADPATFVPLAEHYAKDSRNVYYRDSATESAIKLQGADAASFEVMGRHARTEWDAQDKQRRYREGKPHEEESVGNAPP